MKDLKNKIAVISGASEGIGRAVALRLARAGAVAIPIARSQDKLDALVAEIKAAGGQAEAFACDMRDVDATVKTLQAIEAKHGAIDLLVNNVGAGTFKPLDRMTLAEAVISVDLPIQAAVVATHTVLPGMLARARGHIVNLTSPSGYFPLPNMLPYTAARHAMNGFSLGLYEEMRKHRDIHVTLICPAQVNTGYFDRNDADMGWYPRIAKIFPVLEADFVADRICKAIIKNKREVIFPFILWFFIRHYQQLPKFTFWFLRVTGLMRPSRQ
ncbi:MAG: SDR family NAD(P)-dependent oxidoreductase [Leptospirales bacterium]|jgi:short-subunit dehydrogenase